MSIGIGGIDFNRALKLPFSARKILAKNQEGVCQRSVTLGKQRIGVHGFCRRLAGLGAGFFGREGRRIAS